MQNFRPSRPAWGRKTWNSVRIGDLLTGIAFWLTSNGQLWADFDFQYFIPHRRTRKRFETQTQLKIHKTQLGVALIRKFSSNRRKWTSRSIKLLSGGRQRASSPRKSHLKWPERQHKLEIFIFLFSVRFFPFRGFIFHVNLNEASLSAALCSLFYVFEYFFREDFLLMPSTVFMFEVLLFLLPPLMPSQLSAELRDGPLNWDKILINRFDWKYVPDGSWKFAFVEETKEKSWRGKAA